MAISRHIFSFTMKNVQKETSKTTNALKLKLKTKSDLLKANSKIQKRPSKLEKAISEISKKRSSQVSKFSDSKILKKVPKIGKKSSTKGLSKNLTKDKGSCSEKWPTKKRVLDSRTCAKKLLERLDNAINDSAAPRSLQFTWVMFWSTCTQTPKVYFPILMCHILVLLILHTVPYFSIDIVSYSMQYLVPQESIFPEKATKNETTSKKTFLPIAKPEAGTANDLWVVIPAAAITIVLLAIISFCFLKCIRSGMANLLRILYHFNFIMYFSIFPLLFIQEIVYVQNWACDKFLLIFVLYNFCICGVIAMFYNFPKPVRKAYLIFLCAMTSTITIKLISQTLLIPIVVLFCIWDCYAVLDKNGPLNQILQEDGQNVLPVVFQYLVWFSAEKSKKSHTSFSTKFKRFDSDEDEEDMLEIGLGDFIFYTIVVGKAFLNAGLLAAIMVCLFLFVGLGITTVVLNFCKNGFPALPIPLTLALLPLLLSQYLVQYMRDEFIQHLIFI